MPYKIKLVKSHPFNHSGKKMVIQNHKHLKLCFLETTVLDLRQEKKLVFLVEKRLHRCFKSQNQHDLCVKELPQTKFIQR